MPPKPAPRLPDAPEDRFLRLSEIARLMSLSERTIHRLVADPDHPLPVQRFGRAALVRQSEFEQWLRERREGKTRVRGEPPSYWVRRAAAGLRDVPFRDEE
jgi:excisionase family DNA binding protein